MRTTVNIDDDVLLVAQDRARRERRSLGAVLSELARRGLQPSIAAAGEPRLPGFTPLPTRGVVVTDADVERLRDELGV
ncbi:MAG: antitoxin [Frankiales bacterium]|nr:antitoxin [Frankiales bacterium]